VPSSEKINNMKKVYHIQALLIFIILLITGCTKDFKKMNQNPNSPTAVPGTNVLASGIITSANSIFGTRLNVYYAGSYAGHFQNIGAGDYEYRVDINNGSWVSMYTAMNYFVDAGRIAEKEGNTNLQAVALTLKAYVGQKTTDMWGDIPYTEAFKAEEGISYPVYDKQQVVYSTLLAELKTAADMFNNGTGTIGAGDFIFKGNTDKWKAFCNSLRLRVAIRISNVDLQASKAVIAEVLGNPSAYPVITANAGNAYLYYPGVAPDQEIWSREMGSAGAKTTNYRTNWAIIEALKSTNDPRLPVYADKNRWGVYNGYRFYDGQTRDTMNNGNNVSHVGNRFSNDPKGFIPFMNAAEVYFIKAEAYERGIVTGNARQAYEAGITASLEENGISPTAIATYLGETGVAWGTGTTTNLHKIYFQKWISLYKQSVEAWSESRRTDVPVVSVSEDYAQAHNRPPFRLPYADEERTLNEENFPTDVKIEDIFYGDQVWWDTRTGVN
jgi:hypothetical protein